MSEKLHLEKNFEEYITNKIKNLENSNWVVSDNDKGFDPNTALYLPDLISYLEKTQQEKLEKYKKTNGSNWQSIFVKAFCSYRDSVGTVQLLRKGASLAGFPGIICSGGIPDDKRITNAEMYYNENILRVMRQVHYQTAGHKSLDLVFFINGIAVATAEVKTELTQTVQDAIEEYQNERKPVEPGTRRRNPLLMYKSGAIVHFAISEDEIYMYAGDLGVDKPKFLPFNKGKINPDGTIHAGNTPMKVGDEDYPTGYFWNEICNKENWIRIFHNFIFEEVSKKEDATGRLREFKTQLFPRYHQWNVVTKVINSVKEDGVGQRYLIEHSAGSGKTETITWIAHELIRMMNDTGNDRLFSSVIVVTDRLGLDTNIKKTIKQLKNTDGLIEMIGGDENGKKLSSAKSTQLAKALHDKKEIIVVTLQTFPYVMEKMKEDETLEGANFAILIDEAHNSQSGKNAGKMKTVLSGLSKGKKDTDLITDEDLVNGYLTELQASRVMPKNISFFAFTATPSDKTFTLFGTDSNRIDEKTGKPIPVSFDKYPMRQAIEEGYIIDVLKGYMPYKTAYKLLENIKNDTIVDENKAISTIAKWKMLHPTNVMEKAQFIVEHFVKNVSSLLNSEAKAMVVTSSRAAVVRYKYAISAYLETHPEYNRKNVEANLQFKVLGEPLVAFSGSITGEECIMPEDEYLETNPFAIIKRDYKYDEDNMNNLGYRTIEKAFDEKANRMMIVANKFQVGFNQPKLCAMYIDKTISNDIEIVQTYNRLNRKFPGKDKVFIVDFVNDPETVCRAFKKYDQGASMEQAQDLNIVYEIKNKLDDSGIYTQRDFEAYSQSRYESIIALENNQDSYRKKLYASIDEPVANWKDTYANSQKAYIAWKSVEKDALNKENAEAARQAKAKIDEEQETLDKLATFKKLLKRFVSAYSYISQIVDLGDPDLEIFEGFASLFYDRLSDISVDEIDISSLVLSDYHIKKIAAPEDSTEDAVLRPMSAGNKGRASKKESLKAIIEKLNEIFGDDENNQQTITKARTINAVADYVSSDPKSRAQIQNSTNSKETVIADGRLNKILSLAIFSLANNDMGEYAKKLINDSQSLLPLAEMIFDLVAKEKRLPISELTSYVNTNNEEE